MPVRTQEIAMQVSATDTTSIRTPPYLPSLTPARNIRDKPIVHSDQTDTRDARVLELDDHGRPPDLFCPRVMYHNTS